MPGIANYQIRPPVKWEDFEDLCLDLWRKIWRDDNAQKHGRSGQPQHGVDVFGRPGGGTKWAGVQCKGKTEALGTVLTNKELLEEVGKAKGFQPPLSEFVMVTTGPRDVGLQASARRITEEHVQTGLFSVHVWSWDDVLQRLNEYPDVASLHFPHFHPVQSISMPPPASGAAEADATVQVDAAALAGFSPPHVSTRMLTREALLQAIEAQLESDASVYLHARSGFGKSVLMSQLRHSNLAWIDAGEHTEFAQFRQRLGEFVQAKYRVSTLPEAPRELARALDKHVAAHSNERLVLAIDDADRIDNGVKAFLEELIGSTGHVRLVVTGSTLRFKRQQTLEAAGRLRVFSASELAFTEGETIAVITAPLAKSGHTPSADFARLISRVTHGWPIAVQLVRARLEREPDEDAIVQSLENLGKQELSAYLMDSFWTSLSASLRALLLSTSIFHSFDRLDAQAVAPAEHLDNAWDELLSLPFVIHFPQDPSLLLYHSLFRTFLEDRLSKELSLEDVRGLHRIAATHFVTKSVPPGALHHAKLAGDQDVLARAVGSMADYVSHTGKYSMLRGVLDEVSPTVRWNDPMLAVQQGRLYEHDDDLNNALKWYRRAQELFDQQGPEYWRNGIVNDIGGILRKTGKTDEAIALYDAVLARLPADAPSLERAGFIANRANVLLQRMSLPEAEAGFREAKQVFELHHNAAGLARVHHAFAQIAGIREQEDQAVDHLVRAFRWALKAENSQLLIAIAPALGQHLMERDRWQFAHRVYEIALSSAAMSGSPELTPFLLTNFGLACALLPEPDPDGIAALVAANAMKRHAGLKRGGTLQNLSTLLMRLGEFGQALLIVREEAEIASRTQDSELAKDAEVKLAELASADSVTAPSVEVARDGDDGQRESQRRSALQRFAVEGRIRAGLRRRGPLLRDVIAAPHLKDDHVRIEVGSKSVDIHDARTILVLLPETIDVSNGVPSEPAADENFIFELVWAHGPSPDEQAGQRDRQLSAIWWVRVGDSIWIQQFWHHTAASPGEPSGMEVLKGNLFAFDSDTNTWRHAEHPEGCNCDSPEVHEETRRLASALMAAYSESASNQRIVISKRAYPVVSLLL